MQKKNNYGLTYLAKFAAIAVGAVIYAFGFQIFLFNNNIPSGGLAGIAMIINHFTNLPVGTMIMVFNVPIFLYAGKKFGIEFLIASLAGTVIGNTMIDIFAATGISLTNDVLLAAIIGGAVKGAGLGIVFYVGATTGGFDIVAKLVRLKLPQLNFGTVILVLDMVIIMLYAVVLGRYESAMYAVIAMYVGSKVIDLIIYGFDNSSLVYIISADSKPLIKEITEGKIHRGVTILEGRGAYSGVEKDVIMCVVKRQQIGDLKRTIRSVDENAFVIISDVKNVFGNGFGSIYEK